MALKAANFLEIGEITEGPQVSLSKTHLYMENYAGTSASNDVVISNTGTSAVFYVWKKYTRPDFIKSKRNDFITRFYCHHCKGMLLPGESKRFVFTFISKKTGIFTEEWDLHTDPLVVKPIPQLILTGRSFETDKMIAQRYFFTKEFNKRIVLHTTEEILGDIIRSVRTPTPPPPDLTDSKQCQEQFEAKNLKDKVWHTNEIIFMLRELEKSVLSLLPAQEPEEPWDLSLESLRTLINKIPKQDQKDDKLKRLDFLIKLAKAKPPKRSIYWAEATKVLISFAESIPNISSSLRTELDLEDYKFRLPWELSQEELDKIQKEKMDKELSRAKLAKGKKGKTEDDINKDRETYKEKLVTMSKLALVDLISKVIDDEKYIVQWDHVMTIHHTKELPKILKNTNRLNKHMKNSNIANYHIALNKIAPLTPELNNNTLGSLSRKFSISDADLEGKKVLIRLNLNLPLSEEIWETEEVDVQTDPDLDPIIVNERHCLLREITDPSILNEAIPTIRYCLDHLAKCVIIMGTLGPIVGDIREEYTLLPIAQYLQDELETEIHFIEEVEIDNFEEKIEDLPENSIILLENAGFHIAEIGVSSNRDKVIKHLELDKIKAYREKLSTYCDVFINEALDDRYMRNTGNDYCSIVNPGSSSLEFPEYGTEAVLGLKMDKDIKVLVNTFFEPERPLLALIGYNSQSRISTLDKIVMIYALLDIVDKIFIGGELALIFLSVTQKIPYEFDEKLLKFIEIILNYSKEVGKELIFPIDLTYAKEVPGQIEGNFTWAHNCQSFLFGRDLNTEEGLADGNSIVGFGEGSKNHLETLLYECRRFYWCGSLDIHYSDKVPLCLLNKTTVEFFKLNKDSRELHVAIQDVEHNLLVFFDKPEPLPNIGVSVDKNEEDLEEEDQDNKSDHDNSIQIPLDNSPQEALDKLFNQKLSLCQFIIDILQAKKVRPIEVIKEHPQPKPKSVEEDNSYLEII
jgi:3-phosphoglycerate kinase